MHLILFDTPKSRINLFPLTLTRPVADLRVGIWTIAEKWSEHIEEDWNIPYGVRFHYLTDDYLQKKYPPLPATSEEKIYINGAICPNKELLTQIFFLEEETYLKNKDTIIAFRTYQNLNFGDITENSILFEITTKELYETPTYLRRDVSKQVPNATQNTHITPTYIRYSHDIFGNNGAEIALDFAAIRKYKKSQPILDKHTIVYNPDNVFIEEGADLKACVLNAEKGFIYIGENAQVQEMSVIQGNFALCEGSVVNMGSKMKGDTTIGPYCKVGGEISNSVIWGYSNKGHEGFLGNSVIGQWCNLGADTNTSNLKNNYSTVKIWNYEQKSYIDTNKTFCGLTMGDHAKAGINTMFNTGTVVGVSANVFGGGFPSKFIPSFAWSEGANFVTFDFQKALEVAQKVMQRRNLQLSETEKNILEHIFSIT